MLPSILTAIAPEVTVENVSVRNITLAHPASLLTLQGEFKV